MKILKKISVTILSLASFLASCESVDLSEGRNDQVSGLLNVTIKIPGNPTEYYATNKGPYSEGEEIQVKMPTTDDSPLDLTRLACTVSVEHNCFVDPPIAGEIDFTEPYKVSVVDVNGTRHNNTIRIVPIPPKTRISSLWSKNCTDLGIASRNNTGVAMNDNYLAVQEYDGKIYLYDKESGALMKTVDSASSFMMKIDVDDSGHFVTSRENIYSAGFMVYYYDEAANEHKLLLNYTADSGCPSDLGYEMSVKGDVAKGRAFIYGIAPNDMNIYYWELNDGKLVTPANTPNKLRYGPAKQNWSLAQVQRATLETDSDHYISYFINSDDDAQDENNPNKAGSRFDIFTPFMEVNQLQPLNHSYKILDFKVLDVDKDQYLVTNEQGYSAWANSKIQVFDITNRSNLDLQPGDDGYDKFCIFTGEDINPTNYNKWGDVAVYKKETSTGFDIYIAASTVGYSNSESTIRMYKMNYYRQ